MATKTATQSLRRAIRDAIEQAGGVNALARKLGGVSPQAVSFWPRAPVKRVLEIEKLTGVSRYKLRPDIFGSDPKMLEVFASKGKG